MEGKTFSNSVFKSGDLQRLLLAFLIYVRTVVKPCCARVPASHRETYSEIEKNKSGAYWILAQSQVYGIVTKVGMWGR